MSVGGWGHERRIPVVEGQVSGAGQQCVCHRRLDNENSWFTESGLAPPIFVAFTNRSGKLHFSFERFLENRIRERLIFWVHPS
ncbi:MAG TPA: hypothetical protein VKO18_14325 [Terriglobia bacterium]|nr:hypothetical protein [Terriglobia bacterium]